MTAATQGRKRAARKSAAGKPGQKFPPTDVGTGELVVARNIHRARYVEDQDVWATYSGQAWKLGRSPKDRRAIRRLAVETIRSEYGDASELGARYQRIERINAAVSLAADLPTIAIRSSDLDPDPELINFPDVTVNLRTGEVRDHDPDDLITMTAGANYDPDAKCPHFMKFLEDSLPDPEVRRFVIRLLGYCLLGKAEAQIMPIFHGKEGRNGKSVLLGALRKALGEYAQSADPSLILASNTQSASGSPHPEQLRMRGKRFVAISETDAGRRLNDSLIKLLTGDDELAVRTLYALDHVEFRNAATLILATNNLPAFKGQDAAMRRRLCLVPFTQTFPNDGGKLKEAIAGELPGILALAVRAASEFLADTDSLAVRERWPESVLRETDRYINNNDPLSRFLAERIWIRDPLPRLKRKDFYDGFHTWCEDNGYKPGQILDSGQVIASLKARGHETRKIHGIDHWIGMRFRTENDPADDDEPEDQKACQVCGDTLPQWVIDEGNRTHPACDPAPTLPGNDHHS